MNKKIIKLTESDLLNIVKKVLSEQSGSADLYADRLSRQQLAQNINPKNLKFGDRGDDVKILQQKLFDKGVLKTGSMKPTGYFGDLTNAALAKALGNAIPKVINPKKSKTIKKPVVKKSTDNKNPKTTVKDTPNSSYKYSPRIDAELNYIKQRQGFWDKLTGGKPFFIYDPKFNLIYLFNGDFSLIKSSEVIDGADAQKDAKSFGIEDWCKLSNLNITPYLCTDPKTNKKAEPAYYKITSIQRRFIPKGIYSISSLGEHKGYSGKGNNMWHLKDSEGRQVSAAIHGIPNDKDRLKADAKLAKLLQVDKNNGKVPQQYLDAVNTVIASANLSFGCVGIPASFVEDPKVIAVVKEGVPVYVMGESEKGFLVQNSGDYFDKLGGGNGMCINPMSTAQSMGRSISGPSKPDYSNIA